MKTTESPASGLRPLVAAALVAAVLGGLLAGLGGLVRGDAAAFGALVGTAIAVGVFALGTFAVDAVAHVMPAASLVIALLTYVMQVLVLALVFVALSESGALDSTLDRGWLGGAIVLVTLIWTAVQIRATATARIPVYEPAREAVSRASAHPAEGGAK